VLPQDHQSVTIRLAKLEDIEGAKRIAAQCANELGFVNIATLIEAQKRDWLLIASRYDTENQSEEVIGFINFRIKKDNNCTLYDIAIKKEYRGEGIGKRLLDDLIWHVFVARGTEIILKCPADLPANNFYQRNNFKLYGTEAGRKRKLKIWKYHITLANLPEEKTEVINNYTVQFYASLTVKPDEIRKLYNYWHQYAHNFHWKYGKPNPFQRILTSPIVVRKKTFAFIKEMKKTGEVKQVMFDSGGYFVQKGQISYYDLHRNLYEFYKKEDWADIYVLPDNPTLRQDS
jgi:ribosomal protein S18 acetylase RimI-like enzyme